MDEYVPFQILTAAELNASLDDLKAKLANVLATIAAMNIGLPGEIARALSAEAGIRATVVPVINALSFAGVDPTGATDSTTGLQNFANAMTLRGGRGGVPFGTYTISNPIVFPGSNYSIDWNGSLLQTTSASADIIQLGTIGGAIGRVRMSNLQFWATVTKTAGACIRSLGMWSGGALNNVSMGSLDFWGAAGHRLWNGLDIQKSFGRIHVDEESQAVVANRGVLCSGTPTIPAAELQLDHRSIFNTVAVYIGGSAGGVYINGEISVAGTGVLVDVANTPGITNREIFVQQGAIIDSCKDYSMRIAPNSVAILDLSDAWFTSAGQVISGGAGVGLYIEPNANLTAYCVAKVSGCRFYNSVVTGFVNAGAVAMVTGCQFNNNGSAPTAEAGGMVLTSTGANGSQVTGNSFFANAGTGVIVENGITVCEIGENMFFGNGQNIAGNALSFTSKTMAIRNNNGYQTNNSGTALVPAGTNPTMTIAHGMPGQPASVNVTSTTGNFAFVTGVNPTTFVINLVGTTGGTISVYWSAKMGPSS